MRDHTVVALTHWEKRELLMLVRRKLDDTRLASGDYIEKLHTLKERLER